jgi:hypothetical protein
MTLSRRRFSRRALPRANLAYYLWRFVANGVRTGLALTNRPSYADPPAIGRELSEQGIVVGPGERFLTEEGKQALSDAAHRILQTSRSPKVEAIVAGASWREAGTRSAHPDHVHLHVRRPMTERTLWVRGSPTWALSGIQRSALAPLLQAPPPSPKKKAGKNK